MASENQVGFEVNVETKAAERNIEGLGESFKKLLGPIAAAVASFATIKKGLDEALQDEKAITRLNLAIAGTGEYSKEASSALVEFAGVMSDATGISDDVIVGQIALAKSFGITNDQAKKLVGAAADLAAITGQDLESAVRQLGGTFDGTVGKLANLGPEFRNLTKEQAANGAAIDLINKKYGEAAEGLGTGFEAGLNRVKNAFDDSFKIIGNEIINDPQIKAGLRTLGDEIKNLAPIIKFATGIFVDFFKVIANGFAGIGFIVSAGLGSIAKFAGFDNLAESLDTVAQSSTNLLVSLNTTTKSTNELDKTFENINKNSVGAFSNSGKAAEEAAKKFKKSQEEAQKYIDETILKSGTELEVAAKKAGEALSKIDEIQKKGLIKNEKLLSDARTSVIAEFNEKSVKTTKDRLKEEEDAVKKAADDAKAYVQGLVSNPIEFILRSDFKASAENFGALAAGALSQALNGKQGATNFLGSIAGGLADRVLPGIGGVVQGIFGKLAAGKEQAKAFVKEFIDSMPDIIKAVIDAIPGVAEAIAEVLTDPKFWLRAAQAYMRGVYAGFGGYFFTDLFTKLGTAFVGTLSGPLTNFVTSFTSGLGSAFANFFEQLGPTFARAFADSLQPLRDIFTRIADVFQPLISAVTAAADTIAKATGGKGGGEGIAKETLDRTGIGGTTGAVVGGVLGGPIGAAVGGALGGGFGLTSQDMAIPGGGSSGSAASASSGGGQTTALLAAILQAVQRPMTVQTTAKVNQNAFADIILQLNRQNQRLSA